MKYISNPLIQCLLPRTSRLTNVTVTSFEKVKLVWFLRILITCVRPSLLQPSCRHVSGLTYINMSTETAVVSEGIRVFNHGFSELKNTLSLCIDNYCLLCLPEQSLQPQVRIFSISSFNFNVNYFEISFMIIDLECTQCICIKSKLH